FHLMTHAFFKALLFLGAGSVIHALSGEQDIRKMGGLDRRLPWTHVTFAIATVAIAGIPPLAGFFSKDEILWSVFNRSPVLWAVGAVTAAITAFYMTRLYVLVFRGAPRFDDETRHHLHESPRLMTLPLAALAVLSFFGGFIGLPEAVVHLPNLFQRFLAPVFGAQDAVAAAAHGAAHHSVWLEAGLMAVSFLIAAVAIFAGWVCYERRPELPGLVAERARGVYRTLLRKYYVDEFYGRVILAPYDALCRAAAWFDRWVVDGAVNLTGYLTLAGSYVSVGFDTYVVDGLVNLAGYTVRGGSWALGRLQTGVVQSYATAMILGIFILVSVYLVGTGR
ncbi:MAG: proton-conducting transporter membrane subunit, partial [Candidatus Polarisedimenticolia bacterium]